MLWNDPTTSENDKTWIRIYDQIRQNMQKVLNKLHYTEQHDTMRSKHSSTTE